MIVIFQEPELIPKGASVEASILPPRKKLALKLPKFRFGKDLVYFKCSGRKKRGGKEQGETTPNELRITQSLLAFVAAFFKLSCQSYASN